MVNSDLKKILESLRSDPVFPEQLLDIMAQYGSQMTQISDEPGNLTGIIVAIDESGSMKENKPLVLSGYNHMFESLKGASSRQQIFLGQILFNHDITVFQELKKFRKPNGEISDDIQRLDDSNYQPYGYTALYDAILLAIIEMAPLISYYIESCIDNYRRICILTDGADYGDRNGEPDYDGGSKHISKQDLGIIIKSLLDNSFIHQIIFAGIGHDDYYRKIGNELNIPDSDIVEIENLSETEVRRLFTLFSSIPEQL